MMRSIVRWLLYFAALLVAGPLAASLVASLRAPNGGPDATPLTSESPAMGLAGGLGALGIAALLGLITARLVSLRAGMIAAGLTLAWAAWRTGDIDGIIRATPTAAPLMRLAAEGAILGLGGLIVAILIAAIAPREANESPVHAPPGLANALREAAAPPALLGAAAALVVAIAVAWLVAVSGLRGQAVFAAILAMLFGSAAGRLVEHRTPAPTFVLAAVALAALGPLAAALVQGNDLIATVNSGRLLPVARVLPLDWLAGAFVGIPLGTAWAGSMTSRREGA